MTTPAINDHDPFGPGPMTQPAGAMAPPPARSSGENRPRWLPVVAAVILVIVAFAGGYVVANATATKATTADNGNGFGGQGFGGQGFGPNASGRPRGGGFGGGASGTVGSVSGDQMTITTAAGGSRIVLLTPTTTVTEISSTTKAVADIAAGTDVTVIGTSNPDGSVTATQVVIGNAGLLGRGGFGGGNGNRAPGASTAP